MANGFDPRIGTGAPPGTIGRAEVAVDAGLRSYMLSVYNYMASGVLWTGIVAYAFAMSGMAQQVFFGGGILGWIIIFSPLLLVMAMSFGANRMSTGTAQALYWVFATVMGLSMSVIPLIYNGTSIAMTFFAG